MVDNSPTFPYVMKEFTEWMENDVELENKFLFVTCGDWDLKSMLPLQCELESLQLPPYCKSWLNIKKVSNLFNKN